MKKICIDKISADKGKYTVCLGNGTATVFSNKEKAEQFVSITNQFLTQQLYNINECYQLIFCFYRESWGYLHTGTAKTKNYEEVKRFCDSTITEVQNLMELAVNRSNWTNGNYFTFYHLINAIKGQKQILKELQPVFRSKSATAQLYKIDFYFTMLAKLESDINNYAYLGANLIKIPVHELDYQTEYKPVINKPKLKVA